MNRTQLKIGDKVIDLLFGTWVMGQLIKSGYALASFQDAIKDNPFDFFPKLMYLGAVNALDSKDLSAYDANSFYDIVDELGGIGSEEVLKVINCFTNSMGGDHKQKKQPAPKSKVQ